jgi:hypothetical protein
MATVQESLYMTEVSSQVAEAYADSWDYHPQPGVFMGPDWDAVSARRNLEFLATRYLPRDEAKWVMQQWVKQYNEFTPELLDRLPEEAMVRIAREGSPAIYVKLPFGCKRKCPTAKRMAADERDEVALQSSLVVRYWWD